MFKKLASIGFAMMIIMALSGCGKENSDEIVTLYCGVPFDHSKSFTYCTQENEIKAKENLSKYKIQYVNYDGNAIPSYLSAGKVEKFRSKNTDKKCFLVKNVGCIAVSSNVKPIEVKLAQIEEIPQEVFTLNSELEKYNIFSFYSTNLKGNGDKIYVLEANYAEADMLLGKIIVLDSKYNYLATLLNTSGGNSSLDYHTQIVNLDFDDDLEIVVYGQENGNDGVGLGIFNFEGNKLLGDTIEHKAR